MIKIFLAAIAAIATIAIFPIPEAFAQGAPESDSLILEEVIVTAQRREESLQDVPISISTFTGETLEKSNINSAAGYLMQTPNVVFRKMVKVVVGALTSVFVA